MHFSDFVCSNFEQAINLNGIREGRLIYCEKMASSFLLFVWCLFTIGQCDVIDPLSNHNLCTANEALKNQSSTNSTDTLGPCSVCRYSAKSFVNVYKYIGRQKVKDGLARWEGNNLLLNDATGEDRLLVEIKQHLCSDLKVGKSECVDLFRTHDATLNYWWNNKRKEHEDLISYLCVDTLMVCCPDGYYGPLCKKCPGTPYNVCSKRGQCRGDGTKTGSGKCVCQKGYTGDMCEMCEAGYYQDKTDQLLGKKSTIAIDEEKSSSEQQQQSSEEKNKVTCLPCDKSCVLHCRNKGPRGCEVCKTGYFWDSEYGCTDIDECNELKRDPCKKNSFCVNTEGSYLCYDCDKACDGCHGDGPDMCILCAEDYRLEDKVCISERPNHQETQMEMSRYVTYLGLCMATCIIFRNNIYIASVIGCIVATYIGIAEYTVGGNSIQFFKGFFKNFLR